MSNIKELVNKSDDARHWSPEQMLKEALCEFEKEGAFSDNKEALLLTVDRTNESFKVNFMQAGMKASDCVALCEVAKTIFLSEMEYL